MRHKGSVGRALWGTIHILHEQGNKLPSFEHGLVYFADGLEFEYHEDPEKTKASRTAEGWSTMGDIGYLDDEGYLYLTDRQANMIISGGVNIYPQEAENVLIMHPDVMDAAVFGIPNDEFGWFNTISLQTVNIKKSRSMGPGFLIFIDFHVM